jgi:hypothetical protein
MSDGFSRRQLIARLGGVAGTAALPTPSTPPAATVEAPRRDLADPDLLNPQPLWDKLLSPEELATVAALCDVILPADQHSPAPSTLGVPAFIDEWVSAPYPNQEADRLIIRGGLAWLNTEAHDRFGLRFTALSPKQKTTLCDDIADEAQAPVRLRAGARFFARMRHLTMLGFYTTVEGMKDLGYVGNVALTEWAGAPEAILKRLGLV